MKLAKYIMALRPQHRDMHERWIVNFYRAANGYALALREAAAIHVEVFDLDPIPWRAFFDRAAISAGKIDVERKPLERDVEISLELVGFVFS